MIPKFRVWDTFDEDMVNDIFFSWQDCGYESLNECLSDERWKFMQSTGMFDKNGNEIFEGDVVKLVDEYDSGIDTVILQEGALGMIIEEMFVPFAAIPILSEVDYTLEIIGNIYENPELMEG